MERIAVKSRDIAIVGYEAQSATLEVAFRNGGVYRYQNVPQDVYRQFMDAPSMGTFFSEKIKTAFPYEKIH